MPGSYPKTSTARASHAVYGVLAGFLATCFTLTLLVDFIYWRTSLLMWQDFAEWLLLFGLVFGALAVLARLVAALAGSGGFPAAFWAHTGLGLVVLLLAVINSLVHANDGWTGVVPWGLALSAITFVIMVVTAFLGAAALRHTAAREYRHV
jgi:uncharacterized membrane protein